MIKTWITKNENVEDTEHGSMVRVVASKSVVSAAALGSLLSVVPATTLDWHRGLVVSATALSVVASSAFLGSSWAVVSASSDGHCECDGGWDEKDKEINLGLCFGLWDWLAMGSASNVGVADSLGLTDK